MLLWWALRRSGACANDVDTILLEPGRLTIETRRGVRVEHHEFQPYWARLQYVRPPGNGKHRLLIRSHGRAVEVGSLLNEEQKMALANALRDDLAAAQSRTNIPWPPAPNT